MIKFKATKFLKSAASVQDLPLDDGVEVAFFGRSNSGKSSVINAITGVAKLARSSKTPGRTQLLNFFTVAPKAYLVDLPGYGYAKVAKELIYRWEQLIKDYISQRKSLRGLFIIMDIRHPLTRLDCQVISWVLDLELSIHILLNKADKLTRNHANQALLQVQKSLSGYSEFISVQIFSAKTALGVDLAIDKLTSLLIN